MHKYFKKTIAVFLVLIIFISMVPVYSSAATVTYIEVTKDNAPIRTSSSESGSVVVKCKKNAVLASTGSVKNSKGNKWYKVSYNGKVRYIYSGNVKSHTHKHTQYQYAGVTYKVCKNCGNISVLKSTKMKVSQASTMATYAVTAGSIAAADGPIPVGDVVGVAFLALGAYYVYSGKVASSSIAKEIVTEIDFEKYIEQEGGTCGSTSFRRVSRLSTGLKYQDQKCLNMMEAYICARYLNQDVYTKYKNTAAGLGALHVESCKQEGVKGDFYFEKDANQPTYFYHYHLKISGKKLKAHIFYGTNGYGKYPV